MGMLYNLGCYPASLLHLTIQTMCGNGTFETRELAGFGNLNADGNVCDGSVSVRFSNSLLANLQSTDSYGTNNAFSIQGDNGELRLILLIPWFD